MSSVESLAKWLNDRPKSAGSANIVQNIRIDPETNRTLSYLAGRFSMPKATLASELLRAAIKDALQATPGNVSLGRLAEEGDYGAADAIEEGANPEMLVHRMPAVAPVDDDASADEGEAS